MATFPLLNGAEIDSTVDEQEQILLALASSHMNRRAFTDGLGRRLKAAANPQGV